MNWYSKYKVAHALPFGLDESLSEGTDALNQELSEEEVAYIESRYGDLLIDTLGAGASGVAIDIGNGKVAKITTDETEWGLAIELADYPLDFIVNVLNVEMINNYVAVIEAEKVIPLNKQERFVLQIIRHRMYAFGGATMSMDKDFDLANYIDHILKMEPQMEHLKIKNAHLIEKYIYLTHQLKKHNLNQFEAHAENVGWKDNNLVMLDIGNLDLSLVTH